MDFNVKICDFGLSRPTVFEVPSFTEVSRCMNEKGQEMGGEGPGPGSLTPHPKKISRFMTCHVVSRWYRAPELILMQTKYDSSI